MAKIYLSSTFEDLQEYRANVYHTLRQMHHDVSSVEDYVAGDQRPLAKCLADVSACDIYVGIFALRYGFIPPKDNPDRKSITELEYRKAKRRRPRLFARRFARRSRETAGSKPNHCGPAAARRWR